MLLPHGAKPATLVELLRLRAGQQPDQIGYRFLTFSDNGQPQVTSLTYRQLDAWARAAAVTLSTQAAPGDRVLMMCSPGLEYIAYFFGCLYADLIPVPAYPPGSQRHVGRVEAIARVSEAKVVLADVGPDLARAWLAESDAQAPLLSQAEWFVADRQVLDGREDTWSAGSRLSGDGVAFLQYTSGSTSTPKGVMVTHGNLLANARAQAAAFKLTAESVGVSWLPPYHDMGLIGGIICPMASGFPINLMSPMSFVRNPSVWLETITRYRATSSPGPNFAYQMCVERIGEQVKDRLDLSSWVCALNGAEPVQPEVLERFSEAFARCGFKKSHFFPCYGLAESTLLVSGAHSPGDPAVRYVSKPELEKGLIRPPSDLASVQPLASSGRIATDTDVSIVDPESRETLPAGRVGEIWVRGTSVAVGYWNAPEATEETFRASLSTGEGPYLRTGDLGVMIDDELFVTGRASDLMIFRGRNVYPQDIEATCAESHPVLKTVRTAAFAIEVDGEDALVVVQELPRRGVSDEAAAQISEAIRRRVSEEHQLQTHDIVLIPARKIPVTSSGKIQRKACRTRYLEGSLPRVDVRVDPASSDGREMEAVRMEAIREAQQERLASESPSAVPEPRERRADSADSSERRSATAIEDQIRTLIATSARIEVSSVDVRQPFTSYGLDSVHAVAMAATLSDWLGREVPATIAWDYPSIEAAAASLADRPVPDRRERIEEAAPRASEDPVAVVGIGCRFPGGARGVEGFWDLLAGGRSGISEVPADRWDLGEFFAAEPGLPGRTYTRHAGFVDGVREFDAGLFGIPSREAVSIDPQHRMVLEVAWEALEHAGMAPDALRGSRTGVFLGMSGSDYERLSFGSGDSSLIDAYSATGNAGNFGANRLSYVLGLEGPSMVVDTACSSSLVALHLAVQSLRTDECETALAGGVSLLLSPHTTVALSNGRMLSAEGQCKTFDASADGYVRGEGCGIVVLRRLSSALAAGDEILAVIRGSAVNQDGRSNGLTAPNGLAQREVVRRALAVAGVSGADVGYVEAHGTGTPLGDPIEVRALGQILGHQRPTDRPLALGSVKTNIGHLEAAAGIAGFIKAALTVHRGQIPPHLNLTTPNPHVPWDELPVTVPTHLTPWTETRRLAGVSAFGFGGTNAHVILENPPPTQQTAPPSATDGPVLVKLAAAAPEALRATAQQLATHIQQTPGTSLTDLAWTANTGRAELTHRATAIATTPHQLTTALNAIATGQPTTATTHGHRPTGPTPKTAFLIPGHGAHIAGALTGLYGHIPAITNTLDSLTDTLGPVTDLPLRALLTDDPTTQQALTHTQTAQPALYALAITLGTWWRTIGIEPDTLLGHSVGAYAAAALAGVFTPQDGARLITTQNLGEALAGIRLREPELPLVSDASGAPVGDEVTTADYWLRRTGEPSRFSAAMRTVLERGTRILVELGPGDLLATAVADLDGADDTPPVCLPSVATKTAGTAVSSRQRLLESLARVWAEGSSVDWSAVTPGPARSVRLPTYPFQRTTYWLPTTGRRALPAPHDGQPLRPRLLETAAGGVIGETELSLRSVPFLEEHRVHGRIVVPGVVFLELVLRTAARIFDDPVGIEDLSISRPLVLSDDDIRTVQVVLDPAGSGRARVRVYSKDPATGWHPHLGAVVVADGGPTGEGTDNPAFRDARARCRESIEHEEFYRKAWHPSFALGPSFQLVERAEQGNQVAVGRLVPPDPRCAGVAAGVRPDLLLLDACVQLVAVAAQADPTSGDERPVHLGTGYERMTVHRPVAPTALWCTAVTREATDGSLIGDLRLTDENEQLIAELHGVSFRPVSPLMLDRLISSAPGTAAATGSDVPRRGQAPRPDPARLRAASRPERHRLVLDHLVKLLASVLGAAPEDVETELPVPDFVDSLMLAEFKTAVDRDFDVTLGMEVIFQGGRLTDLAAWVASEMQDQAAPAIGPATPAVQPAASRRRSPGSRRARPMTVEEMAARAELEPEITAKGAPEPAGIAPDAVLLTGATGFVGAFLLAELLNRRSGEVHCLVRASDPEHAARRILGNLENYGIDVGPHRPRIVPVVGDLEKPLLGLAEREFTALHARVGSVFHCGAVVKWTYPYSGLEAANVGGTREVLRLATTGAPRPVHFISTVGVFSSRDFTAATVSETDDLRSSGPLVVGYAQSKWVAEQMVRTASARGVPVTIHRVNTGGHSTSGAFNRLDHLCMIVKGCAEAGIAPEDVDMTLQPAPVDYVARAVVRLSSDPELSGRTFHLVNEADMTWSQFFDCVERFGYPLQRLTFGEWKDRVTGRRVGTMALLGLVPFLNDAVDDVRLPVSESSDTRSALDGTGVSCPPLDAELVRTYLKEFVASGFMEPPPGPASP